MANNNNNSNSMSFDIQGYDDKTLQHLRTLVSIDYVRVNTIDDGDRNKIDIDEIDFWDRVKDLLYGTVIVTDCCGDDIVYHRNLHRSESKGPGEYISLTGPYRPISGHDSFIISVILWVKLWYHDLKMDKEVEIAKGDIVWDPDTQQQQQQQQEDQSSYETVVLGEHGSVSVGYSVKREALHATVKVVWMNESPAGTKIHGTIKALGGGSSTPLMLFDKSARNWVEPYPRQSIHLTRPRFPVPVHSCLTIEADLRDHHNDQIVLGSLQFHPIFGTQTMNIAGGKYGEEVQVSITCE